MPTSELGILRSVGSTNDLNPAILIRVNRMNVSSVSQHVAFRRTVLYCLFGLVKPLQDGYSLCMPTPNFLTAAAYPLRGVQLVNTSGIRRFVFVPLLINIVVFTFFGWMAFAWFVSWLEGFSVLRWASDVPILGTVLGFLRGLIAVAIFLVLVFLIALFSNLLAAPFNGLLAERVEAHLTGVTPPDTSMTSLLKALPRTIGAELRKLLYLALMLLGIGILHWIPLVNIVAPFLLIAFGAWMFAIEYWDYPMGNHGALFGDVRKFARAHKPAAFGFGSVIAIASSIPFVNFFVMPVAVAGATALYVEHFRDA